MIEIELPKDGTPLPLKALPKIQVGLLFATVAVFLYAVVTRHWSHFLLYVPLCGVQAAVFSYLAIALRLRRGERPMQGWVWVAFVGPVLMTAFVGAIYYSWFVAGKDIFLWFDPRLTSPIWRAVFIGLAVLGAGTFLFWFRCQFRFVYGLHEAVVGAFVAGYHAYRAAGVPSSWDSGVYLALVTAGVYLVVRGFDNMHLGITKEPYDGFGRDLFRDSLDKKPIPNTVKVAFYPSDIFFGTFPDLPRPVGAAQPPLPRGFTSPLPSVSGRSSNVG